MSLFSAVWEPLRARIVGARGDKSKQMTSLIEEFQYPKYGPGMMWERCRDIVVERGSALEMQTKVTAIRHADGRATAVVAKHADGTTTEYPCQNVISSMPFRSLLRAMDPPASEEAQTAAKGLAFRDFLTIALVVPESAGFPDNWIYVHSPDVRVGRVQNFGEWSPYLVKDGRTCLGLEYFVFEGDDLWSMDDDDLVTLGGRELEKLGLITADQVEIGYVVRMPKAYPVYDEHYKDNVAIIRQWLDENVPNVYPVGRNGMHKYNNQDHSMFTAMLSVENILGAHHDIWSVNVEEEYHEAGSSTDKTDKTHATATPSVPGREGTGRDAPVIPRAAYGADHPLNAPGDD
jgi:protoporphyrinogen oxidase